MRCEPWPTVMGVLYSNHSATPADCADVIRSLTLCLFSTGPPPEEEVQRLVEMGFNRDRVLSALNNTHNNVEEAMNILLLGQSWHGNRVLKNTMKWYIFGIVCRLTCRTVEVKHSEWMDLKGSWGAVPAQIKVKNYLQITCVNGCVRFPSQVLVWCTVCMWVTCIACSWHRCDYYKITGFKNHYWMCYVDYW